MTWHPPAPGNSFPRSMIACTLLALACCLGALLAQPVRADEGLEALDDSWRLVSDRNDIQVYMRHRDDTRLKTFRGVTRFKLADQYALVAVLNDYEAYPRWLHLSLIHI